MGLVFDNFDEMTNTLSGVDTVHDPMGITYQNIPKASEEAQPVKANTELTSIVPSRRKDRKRSLETEDVLLVSYRKNQK